MLGRMPKHVDVKVNLIWIWPDSNAARCQKDHESLNRRQPVFIATLCCYGAYFYVFQHSTPLYYCQRRVRAWGLGI